MLDDACSTWNTTTHEHVMLGSLGRLSYLRKVLVQQLPDGRCLENIDAHASNVRQLLGPAMPLVLT